MRSVGPLINIVWAPLKRPHAIIGVHLSGEGPLGDTYGLTLRGNSAVRQAAATPPLHFNLPAESSIPER